MINIYQKNSWNRQFKYERDIMSNNGTLLAVAYDFAGLSLETTN